MTNEQRRELLYKARNSGYPGSILDVFAAYSQGRDLIGEYEQEQRMQQVQQMSDFVASQTMQPNSPIPQQEPQQMQAPQSQPPSVSANVPLEIPQQQSSLVDSSKSTNVGLVPGQTGAYKGEAIFAKGGFKKKDPPSYTLPTLEVKATRNAPVPKMLEPGFQDELDYLEARNKLKLRQQLEGAQARFMGGENILDAIKDQDLAGQAFQTMVERYPDDKRLTSKEMIRGKAVGSFLIQKAIERYLGKQVPKFSNNQNYQYAVEGIKRGNNMVGPIFEIKQFQDAEREAQNQYSNYTEELQDKVDTYEKAHGTYQPGLFERMRKTHFKFKTGGLGVKFL